MSRVYLPTTLAGLAGYVEAGVVAADADRVVVPAEDEQAEYDALMAAAERSAAAQPPGARRVVVVAEPEGDPEGELRWRDVVAVHADPAERPPDADPSDDLAWYATQEVESTLLAR